MVKLGYGIILGNIKDIFWFHGNFVTQLESNVRRSTQDMRSNNTVLLFTQYFLKNNIRIILFEVE